MKKAFPVVAVALFSLLFVVGQSPMVLAAGLKDPTIVSKLLSMLAGHNGAYKGVDVHSKGGVVDMKGTVASEELKSMAGDLAKQINGVTEVNNNLMVKEKK